MAPVERDGEAEQAVAEEEQETQEEQQAQGAQGDSDAVQGPGDDGEDQEEAQQPRAVRDPGQPTQAMIDEHDLTHIPYRPWCDACVRGKAKRKPSRTISGAYSESQCARVRMDYAYLTENVEAVVEDDVGESGSSVAKAESSLTILVMQESQCKSVWAYAVEHKGSREEWVTAQAVEDLETVGLRNDRVVLKSDQETSVVSVLKEIARQREAEFGTAIEEASVGESDSNASVERAIQDVEGQTRTLRAALEKRLSQRVRLGNTIVPWLVRHAACLITRCRVRPSGKTSLEMMKGRMTNSRVAEFGETVMFKIPKTKFNPGKFEDQWDSGVFVGFDMRSTESLIGTPAGVFRVTDIRRKPFHERLSASRVIEMKGNPKQPVPGQLHKRTPAFARKFGQEDKRPEEYVAQPHPEVPPMRN